MSAMSELHVEVTKAVETIDTVIYERDVAVGIIQGLLGNDRPQHETLARAFLASMGKLTTNELPRDEREEYENATANAK